MTESCDVTVVIPVYNGEYLLPDALGSVLAQDFSGFEVLLLDDGSLDGSWNVIVECEDPRVRKVRHANRGLAATLNRGVELAKGRYLARQDQDDKLLPGRLAKQWAFLEAHPDVAMVGTWAQIFVGERPTDRCHRHSCSDEALRFELLFDNPFVHSSMMIRVEVLRDVGGYCEDPSRQPPEDYELWSRIGRTYRLANLPEVLTVYREVPGSMSRSGPTPFRANVLRISSENLHYVLGANYSEDDCLALSHIYHGVPRGIHALSKASVTEMLEQAAVAVAGESANWSGEFRLSYRRVRRQVLSRFGRWPLSPRVMGVIGGLVRRFAPILVR